MNLTYLTEAEVLALHAEAIRLFGGADGVRDAGLLASALAQPRAGYGGVELYPTLAEKAAAVAFSIVKNHPFVDGNKRAGFAVLDVFLRLNGFRVPPDPDDGERTVLAVASGGMTRDELAAWVAARMVPIPPP